MTFRCSGCGHSQSTDSLCPRCGEAMVSVDDDNPYAAPEISAESSPARPAADDVPVLESEEPEEQEWASRWSRLFARFLDTLIVYAILFGVMVAAAIAGIYNFESVEDMEDGGLFAFYGLLIVVGLAISVVQWTLLTRFGQTLGKMALRIRVVEIETGGLAGFAKVVVLREWIVNMIGMIPIVGSLFGIVNVLFIFGEDQRCLHDRIAGTRVVKVR